MAITPEDVLAYTTATSDFLCPLSANTYNIDFVYFRIRDLDSGAVLVEVAREEGEEEVKGTEEEQEQTRLIRY